MDREMSDTINAGCREAATAMGRSFVSTSHFIADAVEWLSRRGGVQIAGDDEDGWVVQTHTAITTCAGGHTLADALAGAVLSEERSESECSL